MTTPRKVNAEHRRPRLERDPDSIHDYIPRRQPGNDMCRICGKSWDAAVHVPLEADE